jgi:transcription initiation factor TFIID subunit 13
MEPRQRPRQKGPQFPHHELASILYACGDHHTPLPETVNCMDEIITDYVIEMCHEADMHARTAGRSKVKVDDFQFALRNDARKLGRIVELLDANRVIQRKRDMFKNQNTSANATQLAKDAAAAQTAKEGVEDEEWQELQELFQSGKTKKGKARALKESAAAAEELKKKNKKRRRRSETAAEEEEAEDEDEMVE